MDERALGESGLRVSVLGFGCGNVGGLMIRGSPAERERAVGRALELGITYFDTAPSYGDGQSERHLGQALRALSARVVVGTKFSLAGAAAADVPGAIRRSLEASLSRLGRDRIDVLYLHDDVGHGRGAVAPADVLGEVAGTLEALRREGKIGAAGLTAKGESASLLQVVDGGRYQAAQVFLNLLNPSAALEVPAGFPAQDYGRLLPRGRTRGLGGVAVRALAGGALSGVPGRHPTAAPAVDPIGSGPDYGADVSRARGLEALVREGHAGSLVEAALRFPLGMPGVSTVLLGYSDLDQLELAAAAVARGPLAPAAMERLRSLWREAGRAP